MMKTLTYIQMPLCTRWWTTATVLTSALVQCQIVTPFQLFYSFRAVFVKYQASLNLSNVAYERISNVLPVLASFNNIPLLWSIVIGSCISRLLPHTIFTTLGGIIWPLTSPVFVALAIRNHMSHMSLSSRLDAISRPPTILHTCLHMVSP